MDSKSLKDRTLPLPLKIKEELKIQVEKVKELHQKDEIRSPLDF